MTFFTIDDDQIAPDTRDILSASAILEITEFRLFELAYERWFGKPAVEKEIERFFVGYMFRSIVPHWVRQFCRDVLTLDAAGKLVPRDFGVFPRPESHTMVQRGIRYLATVIFVVVTLHIVAILVTQYSPY
ncbi:MAG: hypothetical protein GWN84_03375 [Gammaproteobacteria bacterium]|nr:hypothetical protein [Gammaproteobacteria bacterium]NIR59756.1 hypothetical protein [Gammaproteobacteria bacterium]NIR89566.1 hypothetical protein [Gammaproteobacteria bacterium]NIV74808.1 hypothetical protein [Gammaproteobacteria bacterium]